MEHHRYHLAGFELRSEFALPLPACPSGSAPARAVVHVCSGEAPALPAPAVQRLLLEVAPDDYWLEIPQVARYRVRGGSEIVVQAAPSAPARAVAAYLCSYALAALCAQRGLLVVHATAVACSDKAVLIVGRSGCGKSTLGASLAARGAQVLSDDLCIIDTAGTSAMVLPSTDHLTLWGDSAAQLGHPVSESQRPIAGVPKFSVTVGSVAPAAVTIHLLLALREAKAAQSVCQLEALRPLDALASLAGGASLGALLQGMKREHLHLEQCRKVLAQAHAWQAPHCTSFDELPRLAQLIERLATSDTARCSTCLGALRVA
jgi:hypothetical protein